MKATVTEELLNAIARAANETRREAVTIKYSDEYEKYPEGSNIRGILDRSIEQKLQDADLIDGWIERTKELNK